MLNLFDYLTPEDDKILTNYITHFGVQDHYVGNQTWLKYWAESKKKLFHLLGGQLIYKFPYTYEKPSEQLQNEIENLISKHYKFSNAYTSLLYDKVRDRENDDYCIHYETRRNLIKFLGTATLKEDKIATTVKYKDDNHKKELQLQAGMKPLRAIQKVLKYFDADKHTMDLFEEFRIQHSLVLNEKVIHGNMCISIHPMDFLTMSDNGSDWSSCMSWQKQGCFHVGTVEMMNSNCVVCAYLESSTPFSWGDEGFNWSNKKWRQLFYCTKEIIVNGKAYPYQNTNFTYAILEKLRELAKKNWNHIYQFGIEEYQDMKHIGSYQRMLNNQHWIRYNKTTKHNILFNSNGMYNDMFNDHDHSTKYWCVRNKVKHNIVINYSGKAPCLCCMQTVIDRKDDYELDMSSEDAYNDRYSNCGNVLCFDCLNDRACDSCGNEHGLYTVYDVEGKHYCKECADKYIKICPDCGKPFLFPWNDWHRPKIRLVERPLYAQDFEGRFIDNNKPVVVDYCACVRCTNEAYKTIFPQTEIPVDPDRPHYTWDRGQVIHITEKAHNIVEDWVQQHLKENLKKPELILKPVEF